MLGVMCFHEVSPTSRRWARVSPQSFVTYICAHSMRNNNLGFCMVIKLNVTKILQDRPQMLTRDLRRRVCGS